VVSESKDSKEQNWDIPKFSSLISIVTPENDPSEPADPDIPETPIIQPQKNFGSKIRRSKRLQKKIRKFKKKITFVVHTYSV
jgi:hypothetical protein